MEERLYELETHVIQANPLQPRGVITPESLAELADSIREQGILEPLVVALVCLLTVLSPSIRL